MSHLNSAFPSALVRGMIAVLVLVLGSEFLVFVLCALFFGLRDPWQ